MVPSRATRDQLYEAYIVKRLSLEDIRQMFGYHWTQNVTQALKYYRIPRRPRDADLRWSLPLSYEQRQIAVGTLLGDGFIKRPASSRHAILAIDHCSEQLPYLKWKLEMLKPFTSGKIQPHHQREMHHGQTFSHPEFSQLDKLFYPSGKKVLPIETLEHLTALAIAVWYMDDGTYSSGRSNISTCAFGFQATQLIAGWFSRQGLPAKAYTNGRDHASVQFSKAVTPSLHERIAQYIHPSMAYKLDPKLIPSLIPQPTEFTSPEELVIAEARYEDLGHRFPHLFFDNEEP